MFINYSKLISLQAESCKVRLQPVWVCNNLKVSSCKKKILKNKVYMKKGGANV